jgi:predicted MFS family arabinose efflux permease
MSKAIPAAAAPTGAMKWTVVGTVLLGAFIYSLNAKGTILETNIIIQEFALDHYKAQWITGAEGVVGLTLFFSSIYLIKRFGARRVFIAGAICLTVGCIIVALARNAWQEGIGGVIRNCSGIYMIPALGVFQRLTPRHLRLSYCTLLTLVYAGQVVAEPLGGLVAFHPTWRALFVFMAVCGVWLIVGGYFLFPDDRPANPPAHAFDYLGAVLFGSALVLIFFLLYRGNYLGWGLSTPICLAAVALAVVIALFILRQLNAPEPYMPLGAFSYQTIALTMLTSGFWCASLYAVALFLPNYLLLIGYQQWKSGLMLLPMGFCLTVSMLLSALPTERGWYVWLLRAALAGMTWMCFQLASVDLYTTWTWLIAVTCLWAACAGLCLGPIAQLTYQGQEPQVAGTTGAFKFFIRAFGATLGVLATAIVLDRGTWWGLEYVRDSVVLGQGTLQVSKTAIRDHMSRHGSTQVTAGVQTEALLGYWANLHAQIIGYRTALRFCAYLSAIALGISCFISLRKEFSVFDADD